MKRLLLVGAAVVGVFLLGAVAGIVLSSKGYSYRYRTLCLGLFEDQAIVALARMRFLAEGHTDWLYNLDEDAATGCTGPAKDATRAQEQQRCIARLKLFYDHYPDRKAALVQRLPDVARALGYATSP